MPDETRKGRMEKSNQGKKGEGRGKVGKKNHARDLPKEKKTRRERILLRGLKEEDVRSFARVRGKKVKGERRTLRRGGRTEGEEGKTNRQAWRQLTVGRREKDSRVHKKRKERSEENGGRRE